MKAQDILADWRKRLDMPGLNSIAVRRSSLKTVLAGIESNELKKRATKRGQSKHVVLPPEVVEAICYVYREPTKPTVVQGQPAKKLDNQADARSGGSSAGKDEDRPAAG